jgi:hypothetical protein
MRSWKKGVSRIEDNRQEHRELRRDEKKDLKRSKKIVKK